MTNKTAVPEIDDAVLRLVRFKSRQLVGKAGLTRSDRQDIEQELLADLLQRLPRFDPARSKRSTFVRRVVRNRIATLLAARCAAARDPARCRDSLHDEIDGDDGLPIERWEALDEERYLRRDGDAERDRDERHDLRIDLAAAIAALPPHLRELCERLTQASVAEIARDTGLPRGTVRGRIKQIQTHFHRAGLDAYARSPSQSVRAPGMEKVGAAHDRVAREQRDA